MDVVQDEICTRDRRKNDIKAGLRGGSFSA